MKENGAHFFEGTEKLLEVWFARQQPAQQEPHQSKGSGDLRTIPRYLYTLDFPESRISNQPDQTLEILMSELDPVVMDQFYMKDGVTANDVTRMSGIRDLIPGSVIDATMFNPCGYSMNGMKSDGTYWTIHITPEPEFSYVSFETNISQTSYDDLIRKVVEVFKPGKFVTTLFVNQSSKCRTVFSSAQKIEGFKRLDHQIAQFSDYNFVFTSFTKNCQQQHS
ncbi:S-adenosylmethionine decarboxylase proenzyme isoform X1 [Gavia stellata]|uniref:S-adenosylmethionine decarboxylase proenzyme isoform X1 n=1 Tax=Gavia stellata TaxID=37040 RepID=UPI00289CC218|nr:S-adenosylmethionine decarboxylase proenzyme isoform X1 [Gavia stellata]